MESAGTENTVSNHARLGASLASLVAGEFLWIGGCAALSRLQGDDVVRAMIDGFFSLNNLAFGALALLAGYLTGPERLPGIVSLVLGHGPVELADRHWRAKLAVAAVFITAFLVLAYFSTRPDGYG